MSSLRDHLDARRDLVLDRERRLRDFDRGCRRPIADAVELLVRLEVDVRGAGGDRVDQDLLDVLDDRRVLDVGVFLVAAAGGRRRPGGRSRGPRGCAMSFSVRAGRLDQLVRSRWPSLSSSTTIGSSDEIGLEPDLLERLQVGRVGDGDEQPVAALVQRQDAPRLGNLEVDQVLLDLVERRSPPGRTAARRRRARRRPRAAAASSACPAARCSTNVMPDWLRLRLQRLGLVLGHEPVLRERAREAADSCG